MKTLYWYDFETFGADPRRDRASQFAGIRTDENLNIIGDPLVIYCQPADDFLPNPVACLITGISPQHAKNEGLTEAEFISQIHKEFSEPNTCVVGYNSIRFDDEVTRQLLYRNFYDPYEREWKNGNSRWDIIDMVRLCAATRPEGINWPKKENGSNSFRLEELTVANGIEHADAHDALADVIATIKIAKLIKEKQPKLYDYSYELRVKKKVQSQINLDTRKPVLHVSMLYSALRGCLAVVMPLCMHPSNSNGIVVYDLRIDPSQWIDLPVEEIRKRIFTRSEDLPEGVERIPLSTIQLNKCPLVASLSVLPEQKLAQYEIDLETCRQHWKILNESQALGPKIADVLSEDFSKSELDPDYMIYSGGFFSDNDKALMKTIRATKASDLGRLDMPFRDKRLSEMFFRYRARNFPASLTKEERDRWDEFRLERLLDSDNQRMFNDAMTEAYERLSVSNDQQQAEVLENLQHWVDCISLPYEETAGSRE
ncbi:MAG: exodeoxyribonuclease I [Pseudohongiellaceae bacterium]